MSTNSYYLIIKTKDTAGNISASSTLFTYVYAGVSPPDSVSQTSTADFSTGTTSNTSTANDSITLSNKAGFWQQSRLSLAPGGVGYGAGFAYVSSSNKLYTFRGQNTTDFYEYDIASDTWTAKASAPAVVYRGGDLIEGPSGYLYGLRGETTTTFWRYDIAGDTWSDGAAADPPSTIYYGSSLIFDGEQYVYALRGNNDDAFYRYDTLSNAWESMANVDFGAPVTQINNNVNLGADLAFDGADTIYVSQGNTYTGFSSYSISGDSWSSLPNLPVKAYDGSQIEYDADSNAIYYMSGWSNPFFYKYSIATQTWSKLQDTPITVHYGGSMRNVDGTLHILRGASSTTFWKYNITKATWHIPTIGLFGNEFRGTDYRSFGYGAQITKGDGNYFYLVRGNTDNIFVRYDASSGEAVRMADAPAGFYIGSAMRYDSTANKIYATPSLYIRKFFVYDIATNTWSEETSDPVPVYPSSGSSLTYDGSRYMYWSRGGSASFYRYDTQGTTGAKWTQMANITGSFGYGGSLVYKNGYIYGLRGNNTNAFYRYDVAGNTWSDVAVADLASGKNVYNDGFLVSSGDNSFIACRGANNAECFEYSISGDTWSAIANAPANIYVGGSAATNGTDRIYVIAGGSGTNTYNNGLYTYILSTSTSSFEDSGTFTSGTMDMGSAYKYAHIAVNYTSADNTSLTVYTRTSTDDATYTSWSEATELKTSGSTYTYKINSPTRQYIQVKFELSSADGVYSGRINDFEIGYYEDSVEPTNPTTLSSYATNALATSITTNTWYNYASPYFYWPGEDEVGGATDTSTGSGILGYYVYFGTDANAVPETDGTFTTNTYHQASSLASGSTYYLRIQAVDNASNAQSTVWQPYIYKYDSTLPTNPNTLVANPPGYSATDSFTFSWSGASDADSGVAQYCYKTGAVGSTDTCISESSIASVASYKTGSNTFYVRTKDTAGNYSSDYVTVSYYFSSTAPGAPQNVQVSPTSNTTNAFAFTWEPPTLYYGSQAGLRYYYSVNAFPTSSNVNSVGLEVTYLSEGSYATQNGSNVFYVVAKDEAGNIDYNNYGSVSFIADTSAPGIPQNIEIADISVKETSSWKLAVSWEPPTELGSGLSIYKVYSSTVENASCTGNFADFSYLSSTTGKSFVDTDLEQEIHYYCSKACSSTNDCSAPSDTVSLYPDGKWKVAPSLVAEPFVTVKTKTANITWSTSRKSTSFVKYGTSSGSYGEEVGSSEAVSAHEIDVIGLEPGTTYYYQVLWTDEDGNTGKSDEYTFTTNEAPYVSAVSVSNISLYEAYVTFTLKNATKATVQHGKSLTYGGSVEVSTSKSESTYTVKIDDLTDGTEYHIRIAAEDEESNIYYSDDYIFETLPVPKISNLVIQQVEGFPTATFRLLWQSNTRLSSIVTYYPTNNPSAARDYINLSPKISHEAVLTDLLDETEYTLIIKGKDAVGNEAKFANQSVKTSADLRPPEIINDNIESTVTGVGDEARAQIIISWDTDEPSTSQVEYGVGTSGEYALSTQEDTNLTSNHSLSIPGLDPAKIYHIRIKSKDKNGNIGYSSDIVVITPKATENALNLVVNKLSKTFGFLKNTSVVP